MKLTTALAALTCAGALCVLPAVNAEAPAASPTVKVQLLGLNDFHGQLGPGKQLDQRPVGGAAVLASYLREATTSFAGETLIVHAGDWVGASPPSSGLLQDEPAVGVLNLLANKFCTRQNRQHPRCNIVGTAGNHEFDEGVVELLRLIRGGNAQRGPFLDDPWRGARFPYVTATVVDVKSGKTIFPPYVIKQVSGIKLGVIGAVLIETPSMVVAEGVLKVRFLPEAEAINRHVQTLKKQGVQTIVVTIHQGGPQPPYAGPTRADVAGPTEGLPAILAELDDAVDVVVSGHAHSFTNALMKNKNGHSILVTQAWSAGSAFAAIELTIDKKTRDVVGKTASIIPTYSDAGPGLKPAADVAALVSRADERVAPLSAHPVGKCDVALPQKPNEAGESALGNLIADAQRGVTGAEIALMNQGGIRAGLEPGPITWGELFSIQPFANAVVTMDLTGAEVQLALEQQWLGPQAHTLQVSGLTYTWDPKRKPGQRITQVLVGGKPIESARVYRVAVNSFLAGGGGGFSAFLAGRNQRTGPIDLDVLVTHIEVMGRPVDARLEGRIKLATQ